MTTLTAALNRRILTMIEWCNFSTPELKPYFEYLNHFSEELVEQGRVEGLWMGEELIGLAWIQPCTQSQVKEQFKAIYGKTSNPQLRSEIMKALAELQLNHSSGIALEYFNIHENYQGLGYGNWWMTQLKKDHPFIILCPATWTDEFWEAQGFTFVLPDYMIWESSLSVSC